MFLYRGLGSKVRSSVRRFGLRYNGKVLSEVKKKPVIVPAYIKAQQLGALLKCKPGVVRAYYEREGFIFEKFTDLVVSFDDVAGLAKELNVDVIPFDMDVVRRDYWDPDYSFPDKFPMRPLVVAIVGHINHGKTTLLDTLRNKDYNIVDQEAGRITQRITAFSGMI